ncbi:conserved hypothetical protein [Vibrio coralliirubri]|nr:conserved hypothetical protein [Vibrio coralliirubri]
MILATVSEAMSASWNQLFCPAMIINRDNIIEPAVMAMVVCILPILVLTKAISMAAADKKHKV